MLRNFLIIAVISGCFTGSSYAQSLAFSNISSGFGLVQGDEVRLTISAGDLVAGTLSNNGVTIYHLFDISSSQARAVGIPDIDSKFDIVLYPNPFRSSLYLKTDRPELRSLVILNTNGIIISKYDITSNELDLSGLKPGMYLVKFLDNQEQLIAISKVVKN